MSEFTREDFVKALQNYIVMAQEQAAIRSLNDDFSCIISTYVSRMRINSRMRKKMTKGARSDTVKCEKTHQTILRDLPSQSG